MHICRGKPPVGQLAPARKAQRAARHAAGASLLPRPHPRPLPPAFHPLLHLLQPPAAPEHCRSLLLAHSPPSLAAPAPSGTPAAAPG